MEIARLASTSQTAQPLAYQPPPRAPRWRRWKRRVIVLALVGGAIAFAWPKLSIIWRQRELLYWQYQVGHYTAPPDQVVYEDDPEKGAVLLRQPDCTAAQSVFGLGKTNVILRVPSCVASYRNAGGRLFPSAGSAALFLHQRTSKNGIRKLVLVECDPEWDPANSMPGYFSYQLSRLTIAMSEESAGQVAFMEDLLDSASSIPIERMSTLDEKVHHIRFFAGQPDPNDDSHFAIAYEMAAGRGTVDGWLEPDGHSIRFEVRDGPAVKK